jgi:drug/metabolite transporter (DMT)-like permease
MAFVLALGGAVMYGIADFSGGNAARRTPPWAVVAWSQLIGLAALAAGLVLFPAEELTGSDLLWGMIAGAGGIVGIGLLYRSLAEGTMAVVSPVTAAATAVLPVVVDVATGGRLSVAVAIGVVLAVIAIVTVAYERSEKRLEPRLLIMALGAGAGFALFFIAIGQTAEASGFWPLVGARAVSIPAGFALHHTLEARSDTRVGWGWVAAAGLLDTGANLLVAAALQRGPLGIVSVLASLYPVVTAVAAMVVLSERPTWVQYGAVAVAMLAVVLLVS